MKPLWYNDEVNYKVNDQMVYFTTWDEKGIRYINALIKEDGNYLTQTEFETLTGSKTNFLQIYNRIIS